MRRESESEDNRSNDTNAGRSAAMSQLRGTRFADLPASVERQRSRGRQVETPAPEMPATESVMQHPRIARALGLSGRSAVIPELPEGEIDEQTMCDWLGKLVEGMHPKSPYRAKLTQIIESHATPKH